MCDNGRGIVTVRHKRTGEKLKIAIVLVCLMAAAITAHSIEEGENPSRLPEAYMQAREKIFSEASVILSDNIEDNDLVHVLMETWDGDALVLLVVKKDGSARMVDSAGRAASAPGRKGKQMEKCSAYFKEAEKAILMTVKTLRAPLPDKGGTMFYFFTVNRQYSAGTYEGQRRDVKDNISRLQDSAKACLAELVTAK